MWHHSIWWLSTWLPVKFRIEFFWSPIERCIIYIRAALLHNVTSRSLLSSDLFRNECLCDICSGEVPEQRCYYNTPSHPCLHCNLSRLWAGCQLKCLPAPQMNHFPGDHSTDDFLFLKKREKKRDSGSLMSRIEEEQEFSDEVREPH